VKFHKPWLAAASTIHRMVQVNIREIVHLSVLLGLASSALLAIPFGFYYTAETANHRALLHAEQERIIKIAAAQIYREAEATLADLRYLSQHNEIKRFLQAPTESNRLDLAREYLGLAIQKRIYDRIRFIDRNGRERVRIDFNDGRAVVVAVDDLLDRSNRAGFAEVVRLLPGQIYVSPFELADQGAGGRPGMPVIHLATPVADDDGVVQGYVVLDYLGQRLRDGLRALEGDAGKIRLLNAEGYWLMGATPEDEWAFMFPDRSQRSIAESSPELWQAMQRDRSGIYRTEDAWVRFERVYPLRGEFPNPLGTGFGGPVDAERYYWTLAVEVPQAALRGADLALLKKLAAVYAALVIFLFLVAAALAFAIRRNRALTQVMEKVVDNVPVLVAYVDAGQRYRFNNMAYEKFFGLNPRQIYGKTMRELLGEAAYQQTVPYIEQALAGKSVTFERKMAYESGARDAVISYMPDVTPQGVRGFYVMVNDVSAIRNSQRRERQHMLELAHVSRLASMGEMATQIAHEINQPLAAIAMYSAAAQRTMQGACEREKIETWLEAINTQAKRASEIVRRVRQFVQKSEPQLAPVDLNEIARESAALVDHEAKSHDIQIVLDLAEGLPRARGEQLLLEQVVLNLLRNAMDAVATDGNAERRVTLKTSADDQLVYVDVSDTGPGVDPELGQHIFDSFVTGKQGGLGMGLAISRSIIEAHAGTLRYAAKPGGGAAFTFSLAQEPR
jgi:PAS domain S-box-containing protein